MAHVAGANGPQSLQLDDVPVLPDEDRAHSNFQQWLERWTSERSRCSESPSLLRACYWTFRRRLFLSGLMLLISSKSPPLIGRLEGTPRLLYHLSAPSMLLSTQGMCRVASSSRITLQNAFRLTSCEIYHLQCFRCMFIHGPLAAAPVCGVHG